MLLEICLHIFDTLPSTNQKLWELIDRGAAPGTVVIARQQTSGRGQWGRQWHSPVGGLYLSLALAPNLRASDGAWLTLGSAWGIATALRSCGIPVSIKWPNDLVLEGRKLGGILSETRVRQGKIDKAIVGVGINWNNPVPETGTSLQSYFANRQKPPIASWEMLATVTLKGLLSGYKCYISEGIKNLLPSYDELLVNRGSSIIVNGCQRVIVGVASTGELRTRSDLQDAASEIRLEPGEIRLGYSG